MEKVINSNNYTGDQGIDKERLPPLHIKWLHIE